MTASNITEVVKDGNGTAVAGGWAAVSESTSGAKASSTYLKNGDESIVAAPMQMTGGAVQANAGTNLNTSALALETGGNLATLVTEAGALTETAPASDTASSGLNGRLQRIAQRLSSLITALGSPMQATGGTVGLVGGTAAIGSIIGRTTQIPATPAVTNGAYLANKEVGPLMSFAIGGAGSGTLMSISVTCKTVQVNSFILYVFPSNPSSTTWTDNSTPAINAADVSKCLGAFTLNAPASGLGTHTVWNLNGIGAQFVGATLYGVLVTSAGITLNSTSDIVVTLGVSDD